MFLRLSPVRRLRTLFLNNLKEKTLHVKCNVFFHIAFKCYGLTIFFCHILYNEPNHPMEEEYAERYAEKEKQLLY